MQLIELQRFRHHRTGLFRLVSAVYLVFVAATVYTALKNPLYNWDMLGYIGAVVSFTENDLTLIHNKTYAAVEAAVPPNVWNELTISQNSYRYTAATESNSFFQQLPFYKIRPLYTLSIYGLGLAGIGVVTGTVIVSCVGFVAIMLILLAWRPSRLDRTIWLSFVVAFFLIGSPKFVLLASASTPDALSIAIVLAALYCLVQRESIPLFVVLAVLSIFARTDNIILVLMLFFYLMAFAPAGYRLKLDIGIGWSLVAVFTYIGIHELAGNYGWSTLFWHVFRDLLSYPADTNVDISINDYLGVLYQQIQYTLLHVPRFVMLMVVATMLVIGSRIRGARNHLFVGFLLVSLVNMVVRFVLFPSPQERLFVINYLIIMICAAEFAPDWTVSLPRRRHPFAEPNDETTR